MLKSQQRFKSENHNVFNEEVNKTELSANDDKNIKSLINKTYAYGTSKDLISGKEEIKCNSMIKK